MTLMTLMKQKHRFHPSSHKCTPKGEEPRAASFFPPHSPSCPQRGNIKLPWPFAKLGLGSFLHLNPFNSPT